MKLKLNSATGAVFLTSLWLLSVVALIFLLHNTSLDWIVLVYAAISFLGICALIAKAEMQSPNSASIKATPGKIAIVFLVVLAWLGCMLGVLTVLPLGDPYTFAVWIVWLVMLVVIIGYLESRWQKGDIKR